MCATEIRQTIRSVQPTATNTCATTTATVASAVLHHPTAPRTDKTNLHLNQRRQPSPLSQRDQQCEHAQNLTNITADSGSHTRKGLFSDRVSRTMEEPLLQNGQRTVRDNPNFAGDSNAIKMSQRRRCDVNRTTHGIMPLPGMPELVVSATLSNE